ncbi:SGNH/GDSL hydrolase family protein [Spirulina sp. CS-785/01]|uniref:SGNH/GDSL hydrolase family protein n=1 Tax=Spirulina sp. CS-785/01 TaxID=3021716 RepID=UPI00232F9F7F|nr:SGNH/GDSL hydrolase family protein [Spirulina sp. CS-785/01]MDB9314089.1 SGNH/GDSL hydrolase family protein [Spirulina sp. CS-785/01]
MSRKQLLQLLGFAILGVGLLLAVSNWPLFTASEPTVTSSPSKIMPLGDSITDGYHIPGGYRINLWHHLTEQDYAFDFVGSQRNGPPELPDKDHEGHSGWTISEINAMIVPWLKKAQPDQILLIIGTNDILQNLNLAKIGERLEQLIQAIWQQTPDVTLFVGSIPPIGDRSFIEPVEQYNQQITQLVKQHQQEGRDIYFVDLSEALEWTDLADGVHPNRQGHDKMARVWAEAVLVHSSTEQAPSH